jgi:hypothetical protein
VKIGIKKVKKNSLVVPFSPIDLLLCSLFDINKIILSYLSIRKSEPVNLLLALAQHNFFLNCSLLLLHKIFTYIMPK